jgi:hypothetical protein
MGIEIESLEALAYAEDRSKALDQLPTNDPDIVYYKAIHLQNTKANN